MQNACGPQESLSANARIPLPKGNGASREEAFQKQTQQTSGLLDELSSAFASARLMLVNLLELISLETHRAGLALTWMLALGVASAFCLMTAWLGLMVAIVIGASYLGLHLLAAVIIIVAANLLAGVFLIYTCKRISRDLLFSATKRQLAGELTAQPSAP